MNKKILALLTALTMALSLFTITPAMATGGNAQGGGNIVTKEQRIWDETNLLTNGDLTDEVSVASYPTAGRYGFKYANWSGTAIGYGVSEKEYYSEGKSLFQSKTNGGDERIIASTNKIKKGATYIASVMALGTAANADHWNNNTLKDNVQYQPNIALKIEPTAVVEGTTVWVTDDVEMTETRGISRFPAGDFLTGAANSDLEGERSPKEEWKRLTNTVVVKESAQQITTLGVSVNISLQCSSQNPDYNYMELYTDDYYLGELMVADVELTSEKTITVPNSGKTSVELTAQAYNQLGTTQGLENTEYSYEIVGNPEGVYITGSTLTVTNDAQAGDIVVNVKCEPKYTGAENQTGIYTEYRNQEVTLTLNKLSDADYYANLRNSTTVYTAGNNAGLEGTEKGNGHIWESYFYMTTTNNSTYEVKSEQKYSGSNSLLVKHPENAADMESHFPATGNPGPLKGKTAVASAMVLGTQANPEDCETSLSMKLAYYLSKPFTKVATTGNSVKLNTMRIAPASGTEEQTTLDSSNWKMVYGSAVCPDTSMYTFGAGVVADGKGVEYYVDDYYLGELVVAKIDTSATANKAVIGEDAEVELKATAYNQLGTNEFFDGETTSTYTWEVVSAPTGVSVDGDKLVIGEDAEAGTAVLEVTFNPTFVGADAQTDETTLARRKATVAINIIEKPHFEFNEATGVATAVVGNLDEDAKAYCALYKVLEGNVKKLMNVESKNVVAGGENVNFTTIGTPDYTYEIKCFMWYEGTMKNVIPAEIFN